MAGVRCSVLIGRQSELDVLEAVLIGARAGRGGVVALTGEAGIGKSRLVREAVGKAEQAGMSVAAGWATPEGSGTAFGPLTEALLQLLRDRLPPDGLDLAPWVPTLGAILPNLATGAPGPGTPAIQGEAVIQLLRAVAPSGVVLVLEDLHWADPDTLAVVEHLAGHLERERVACVVTCRSETPSAAWEMVGRLRGRPGAGHLPLDRLAGEQVVRMVRACLADPDDELVSRVQRVAEGVPLLVEDVLASPGVPASFRDTVAARMAQLDVIDRGVVEAAAVFGRTFDWQLLPPVAAASPSEVSDALSRAVDLQLMAVSGREVRFRHALTREAVVEATLPPRRAELAARGLAAVEAAHPGLEDPWRDLAAELAEQAGDRERAGELLAGSGRGALERGALATAVETLRRAMALLAASPEALAGAERLLVDALALAGRADEAMSVGNRLVARIGERDVVGRAEVHLQLAQAAAAATRWPQAGSHLEAAGDLLAGADRQDLAARAAVLGAEVALAGDDVAGARKLAEEALAAEAATPEVRCHALEVLGRTHRLVDLDAAQEQFERALATADAGRLALWRLRALHELGTIELFRNAGTARLSQARRAAVELGALSTVAVLDLQLAAGHHSSFDVDAGDEHARAALEMAERLGLEQVRLKALLFLAENHAYRRRLPEMEHFLRLALAAAPDDPGTEGFAWGGRGTALFLADDRVGALEALSRARTVLAGVPNAEPANFRGLAALLGAAAGDRVDEAALAEDRRLGIDRAFANRGMLSYAEAVLCGRKGDARRATDLARAADATLESFGAWGDFARLCAAEPAMSDGWGDPQRWLRDGASTFTAIGLTELAGRCARLLGSPAPDRWAGLGITSREADVLAVVAEGLSNKEVAARLHVSPRTVEKHLEALMRKTGARSRTQLVVVAGSRHDPPAAPSAPRSAPAP